MFDGTVDETVIPFSKTTSMSSADLVNIHWATIHRTTNNRGHLTGRLITGATIHRTTNNRGHLTGRLITGATIDRLL